ncbi:MAG: trehalose-phosphatase [Candidatus Melainabacteria bacterium]|nr:MAG: trehalose-phosphatase [Candidatus Melainabacteria bacterium]
MKTENCTNKKAASSAEIAYAIERISAGKELLIGFDRDGTIVPYADRPENALLDPHVHESLRELSIKPGVLAGIVSARSMALLRGEFDYQRLFLAGNYGLETALPKQEPVVNDLAAAVGQSMKEVRDKLASLARPEINAIVEDHGYSVCVHWHTVAVEAREILHHHIERISNQFKDLLLRAQPTSYEFLPKIDWDKGRALAQLDQMVPAESERAYVFIGDSPPDEPAFDWVNKRGGVTVKVGSGSSNTCSQFQVADTTEIAKLIIALTEAKSLQR